MSVQAIYSTIATTTGGRDGHAASQDGVLDVALSTPREMGGGGGSGTNPEQLFAAGYSACFLGAMKYVAGQDGQAVPDDATVTATVGIGPRSEGGFGITVALKVALPGMAHDKAQALVEKADKTCPYSNALRGNVDVALSVA